LLQEKFVELNVNISLTTLQRRMKDLEYVIRVPKRKPLLNIVQRKRRVQWSKDMFLEIYSSGNQLFSAMRVSLWFHWITVEKYGEKKVKNIILNAYKRRWSIQLQLWYGMLFTYGYGLHEICWENLEVRWLPVDIKWRPTSYNWRTVSWCEFYFSARFGAMP